MLVRVRRSAVANLCQRPTSRPSVTPDDRSAPGLYPDDRARPLDYGGPAPTFVFGSRTAPVDPPALAGDRSGGPSTVNGRPWRGLLRGRSSAGTSRAFARVRWFSPVGKPV